MSNVVGPLINFANLANALQQQFDRFVSDFNNQRWDDLRNHVLDPKVVVVGIDHPEDNVFIGIDPVIGFLQQSHGQFEPIAPSPFLQVFGNIGYTLGVGYWTDDDDTRSPILFSFVFVNRATSEAPEWKAMRLWASRPLGDLKQQDS